jgi:hypothetical protein
MQAQSPAARLEERIWQVPEIRRLLAKTFGVGRFAKKSQSFAFSGFQFFKYHPTLIK